MALDSVLFEDFKVIIWLDQTYTFGGSLPVTVHNVATVTTVMLYIYPFRCVDPVLLIHKFT